ncbi:WecB/TagA/CpsF family glycosyltransferase [Candidatus Gottesmanbacteria bacterium]|nr:WecB/TagA/CpsF family glycosyltransferase [Candidatus Gottesmanbacteria bacterium]
MSLNAVKMLGISITTSPKKEILEHLQKYLLQNPKSQIQNPKKPVKPLVIVTPNPEQIIYAQKNKHFAEILNQADVAIPDGIGIVLAGRFLQETGDRGQGTEIKGRIAGVELMEDLVAMAAERGYPIALIGGRGRVAVEALECLRQKYPGLVGWAQEPGELQLGNLGDVSDLGEKIQKTNTRLVFVGLGAPKQEFFIERLSLSLRGASLRATRQSHVKTKQEIASPSVRSRNDNLIMMSVGGSFDIISGRTLRAPLFIRNVGLEWLWRLARQPWRWRRQLALVKFFWLVLKTKEQVQA